jgi:OPA family glycerol-3-phosphate transporter-like MFS transporter
MNLLGLLWLVYFIANLGRLSYTASMIAIIDRNMLDLASAGLVGTGFFICYGLGQLISGYIGGRLNPHRLIFIGLFCTALANFVMGFAQTSGFMLVTWCINGLIQSILWPPVLRIIVESLEEPAWNKASSNISTSYPIAVMFAYLSCAGIITILSWRAVFFIYSAIIFGVTGIWALAFWKTIRFEPRHGKLLEGVPDNKYVEKKKYPKLHFFGGNDAPGFAIVLFSLALIFLGILRDGLTTWIPDYITRAFSFPASRAILFAGLIPPLNLCGIYLCRALFARIKNEGKTCIYLFGAAFFAILFLRFAGVYHIYLTLFAFAVIMICMTGVAMMLITFASIHFTRFGLVSFMAGFTNSMVYVGSSISTFGIALVVEKAGWNTLLTLLSILAAASVLFCVLAAPRWAAFTKGSS